MLERRPAPPLDDRPRRPEPPARGEEREQADRGQLPARPAPWRFAAPPKHLSRQGARWTEPLVVFVPDERAVPASHEAQREGARRRLAKLPIGEERVVRDERDRTPALQLDPQRRWNPARGREQRVGAEGRRNLTFRDLALLVFQSR